MRKIIMVVFIVLASAVAGILLINDNPTNDDMMSKTTKVGVLISGYCFDQSFSQTHYEALETVRKELPIEVIYWEGEDGDCYDDIVKLIEKEGCEIIIGNSYDHGSAMAKAADAFPNIYFLHCAGTEYGGNLSSFFGRMYQARYLSGIVAGMRTETGHIGYVAAFPISEVNRGINAFALGVRSVRSDAQIHVKFCKSWTEDIPAGKASEALLDSYPIDVVAMHTNSLQPNWEADRRGVWSIGHNKDNADTFPRTYLTASVWNWDAYYRQEIMKCIQGKFRGKNVWMKMEEGIVSISPLTKNVKPGTEAEVKKAEERLRSREFDVFYGPIKDNQGKLRVGEGESMSDNEMLNGFDWYVEGVTIDE